MNVVRITDHADVLRYWDVFREGLRTITELTGEQTTEDQYCRMLINLAARTSDAWLGLVMHGGPLSYGLAVDSTPPFASRRTFTVISFYAVPGQPDATEALMLEFERWARENGVRSYIVTTRRHSGAIRCFRSPRYGFRRGFYAFEKTL